MLAAELCRALDSSPSSRIGGPLAAGAKRSMLAQIDPPAHNGPPLLGLVGFVVKSRESSEILAMTRAILEAGREARRKVPEKISASMRVFEMEKQT